MNQYIGNGIYSISDVARLISTSPSLVARAVQGYRTHSGGKEQLHPPLIAGDYDKDDGHYYLSFHDLIELRFLVAFRKYGISWQKIRKAANKAAEIANSKHPFCTKEFYSDGSTILTKYAMDENEVELLDLLSDQFEADKIFEPYLHHEFNYSDDELIDQWHPTKGSGAVVLDPRVQFGQPILVESGLPTKPLYDMYGAEDSIERVALLFECPESEVLQAVKFEQNLVA